LHRFSTIRNPPSLRTDEFRMDAAAIASLGTAMNQQNLTDQVSVRVARKALDAQQQQGQAAVDMIDAAAALAKDLASKPAPGRLDVTA
jgi:hypothetical protein